MSQSRPYFFEDNKKDMQVINKNDISTKKNANKPADVYIDKITLGNMMMTGVTLQGGCSITVDGKDITHLFTDNNNTSNEPEQEFRYIHK